MPRVSLLIFAVACGGPTSAPPAPGPPAVAAPSAGPQAALDAMDTRAPVPLQPMMAHHQKQQMRGHLEAIEGVVTALAAEDWAAVETAAARIGSSPQMNMTCEHMGAGADGFTAQALDFHRQADTIRAAAQAHDTTAVLQATAQTLSACTGCHRSWKQELVSAEEWSRRTGGQTLDH